MLILGSVILLLLVALVSLAVWSHHNEEREKNRAKTAPARARRHEEKKPADAIKDSGEAGDSEPLSEAVDESVAEQAMLRAALE